MTFIKTTEQDSKYNALEKMSVHELLTSINKEDRTVPLAVEKAIPQIEQVVTQVVDKLKNRKESKFFRAMYDCLYGLIESDSQIFLQGYEQILKGNRRQNEFSSLEKMISLTAHAFKHLYEEREELDQNVFSSNQKLPFDQGLDTTLSGGISHTPLDLSSNNNILDSWVKELPDTLDLNELLEAIK